MYGFHVTDFVVVGAGSAGSVVASDLSDDHDVLVLERGGDHSDMLGHIVQFYKGLLYGATDEERKYYLTDKAFSNIIQTQETVLGNKSWKEVTANVAGGCQNINGQAYGRLSAADLARWNSPRWTYESTLDDWKATETAHDADPSHHGTHGPIETTRFTPDDYLEDIKDTLVNTFGDTFNPDTNNGVSTGVGYMFRNIGFVNGEPRRQSTFDKMLRPKLDDPGSRVTMFEHSTVLGITSFGTLGTLVRFMRGSTPETVLARKEVVISAGAYDSPKLLQLSGIGDQQDLESVGVQCIVNNANVGANLRESMTSALFFAAMTPEQTTPTGSILSKYYKTSNHTGPTDNMELSFFSTVSGGAPVVMCENLQFMNDTTGYTKLQSDSPFDAPFVTLNAWDNESDKLSYINGFRHARAVMGATTNNFVEVSPGLETVPADATDDEIFAHLKEHSIGQMHTTGTCQMHKVVDDTLSVYGFPNVRVIDNSIIPYPVTSHSTSATATLIGKVGARFIKERWDGSS